MTKEDKDRHILVSTNGYMAIVNTKTGTYDGFPLKEFKKNKDGSVMVKLILQSDDCEVIGSMNDRLDELRAEYLKGNPDAEAPPDEPKEENKE